MEMVQLMPEFQRLKRAEKLYIMQFLLSELAQEEDELIQPGITYPIWSPFNAFDAADKMLAALRESSTDTYG